MIFDAIWMVYNKLGTMGLYDTRVVMISRRRDSQKAKEKKISASADGGPRSRVRARGTLRSAPHRH